MKINIDCNVSHRENGLLVKITSYETKKVEYVQIKSIY